MEAFITIAVGLIGLLGLLTWVKVRRRRYIASIVATRAGEGIDTFRSSLNDEKIDDDIISTVYFAIQNWFSDMVDKFPVMADDEVVNTYGMAYEDIEDIVFIALNNCNRVLPQNNHGRIKTVRDIVHFVAASPYQATRDAQIR